MAWIKRNLFFVIGGVLAIGMLGAAVFYDFKSWNRNSAAFEKLNEIYGTLHNLQDQKLSPGNDKINNVHAAQEQERQLRDWVDQAGKYFQPIKPVPDVPDVTSEAFANALRRTIHDLQQESAIASVTLPPDYGFSFTAQRISVRFTPGSLQSLSEQLGEVKTISEILFAARVNSLDGVQRIRVSDDDTSGPESDYLEDHPVVTDLATLIPYQITFRAFSPEIAEVLANFASSPHGFIVKGINVQQAGAAVTDAAAQPPATPLTSMLGKGGLQTVLKEQLLRVTLVVDIVKLSPGR